MRALSIVFAVCVGLAGSAAAQSDPAQDGSEALTEVTLAGIQRPDGRASNLTVTLPQANHRDWPVVLFIHGWSAKPEYYSGLVKNLASRGFAVANFDQVDRFELDLRVWERAGSLAIDALADAATNPNNPLFGLLDMEKLSVIGHSYGGATTTCLAAVDPRVKVAVALTPGVDRDVRAHFLRRASEVRIPIMILGSEFDPIVPARRFARAAFNRVNAPQRLYVEIARGEHNNFTDIDFGYWQWTPFRFPGFTRTRPADEVREVSRRYSNAWIEHFQGIRSDRQEFVDGTRAAQDNAQRSLSRYGTPSRRP